MRRIGCFRRLDKIAGVTELRAMDWPAEENCRELRRRAAPNQCPVWEGVKWDTICPTDCGNWAPRRARMGTIPYMKIRKTKSQSQLILPGLVPFRLLKTGSRLIWINTHMAIPTKERMTAQLKNNRKLWGWNG